MGEIYIMLDEFALGLSRRRIEALKEDGEMSAIAGRMAEAVPELSKGAYAAEVTTMVEEAGKLAMSVELLFANTATGLARIAEELIKADRSVAVKLS